MKLAERLSPPVPSTSTSSQSSHSSSTPMETEDLPLFSPRLMATFDYLLYNGQSTAIRERIVALQQRDKEHVMLTNVMGYWATAAPHDPEMAAIAAVVLAAPATQVTVERAFSSLPLILTDKRTNLGPDLLNMLLTVKLNKIYD